MVQVVATSTVSHILLRILILKTFLDLHIICKSSTYTLSDKPHHTKTSCRIFFERVHFHKRCTWFSSAETHSRHWLSPNWIPILFLSKLLVSNTSECTFHRNSLMLEGTWSFQMNFHFQSSHESFFLQRYIPSFVENCFPLGVHINKSSFAFNLKEEIILSRLLTSSISQSLSFLDQNTSPSWS